MAIYNSMILWVAIWGIFYYVAHHNSKLVLTSNHKLTPSGKVDDRVSLVFCILLFGYIVFWAAVRSGVADTAAYIRMFEKFPDNLGGIGNYWSVGEKAPGFDTFSIIIKSTVSKNYHIWLAIIAILSGIPIMITLRNRSANYIYSVFLFITMLHFTWLLNGIRQFLAAAVMFGFSFLIEKKKFIPFLFVTLVLSTFHYSVFLFIPVYFIVQGKPFGKRILLFVFLIVIAVFFVDRFVGSLDSLLENTVYEGFTEQFAEDDGVNPLRVLVMLVPPVIAFIKRRKLDEINDPFFNICVNMSIICVAFYFLGVFTSGILIGRLPIFFELYNLILLPFLIEKCFADNEKQFMYLFSTIGYLLFYFLQMRGSYYISDITGFVK